MNERFAGWTLDDLIEFYKEKNRIFKETNDDVCRYILVSKVKNSIDYKVLKRSYEQLDKCFEDYKARVKLNRESRQ